MMKKRAFTKRVCALASALLLLCVLFLPNTVQAAASSLNSIDITVELAEDGSAYITEVWDVTADAGDSVTELYITKYNLDEQVISELTVTDENGRQFENIGTWNSGRSRTEKAYQCGMIETQGGYEICWGFGDFGDHVYAVRYKMTNVVKGYEGADAIDQWFISKDLFSSVPNISVTIRREGMTFTQEDTRVWGFGHTGEIYVTNGEVVLRNTQTLRGSQYVAILVGFEKGMFTPAVERTRTFDDVREAALEGSGYDIEGDGGEVDAAHGSENSGRGSSSSKTTLITILNIFEAFIPVIFAFSAFALFGLAQKRKNSKRAATSSPQRFKDVPYYRELPYGGNLSATYVRLRDHNSTTESDIIGAYLLRWIRSRQVEIVTQMAGVFKNKEESAIRMFMPRAEMTGQERVLYDYLLQASGSDGILQNKEFEKWSRRNYDDIERWLNSVKSNGKAYLRQIGAVTTEQKKAFFNLFSYNVETPSPYGEQLTAQMFGFKKYLEDFTIINEREAREVQLWDEYLVFAQLFGIADKVAQQFQDLYPDYFVAAQGYASGGMTMYDAMVIVNISRSFGRSAASGYRAGYNAAHSSSSSGGGGSYSGGGGSSSSGSGSSGGGFR